MQTIINIFFRRLCQVWCIISILIIQTSCKKFIEVEAPATSINAGNVYGSDETAVSVVTGMYTQISDLNADLLTYGITSISLYSALSSDELTLYNINDESLLQYYRNDLTRSTQAGIFWNSIYPIVFIANSVIESLDNSPNLTPAVRKQLIGEAKFMRAFCYFYLVNLYGDVPLIVSTDYEVSRLSPRTPKAQVYQQIILDLEEAQNDLSVDYLGPDLLNSTTERVRPTKWAATALLARAYLYINNYVGAEKEASAVIENLSLYNLTALSEVFLANSTEAIWQLQPVRAGTQANTGDGALFILPAEGPNVFDYPVYLSSDLANDFETGDKRKEEWVSSILVGVDTFYYPYKYKIGKVDMPTSEYIMMLRLAEQWLIRSEARTQQGDIAGAISDLNIVRERAGLPGTIASDQASLLTAIRHERRVELFTELGHRWFDLRRTNKIDEVMSMAVQKKGASWSPFKALYPIPQAELNNDPSLVQNEGY